MLPQKQAEEAIVSNPNNETEHDGAKEEDNKHEEDQSIFRVKNLLWHGGSAWDAWFSCASNQVAQVLLTLPYSLSFLSSWNISTSHCTWSGVPCDAFRHVSSLDLSGLNLTGTLSSSIGHLRFLLNLTVTMVSEKHHRGGRED
ncbi:hypothetical protein TEA_023756 [Camellia sinensis var. sinensis]|uniref:Leucine-rich repeat-containing N-terminal plant-type domain-containing protein n=1 Tax=Camellia sinensis var. sinensis TaxID=542762 RepID=A0A4S4DVA2_CAMSN|nr:hypothetical protein TEA_023756 [Camellia sinensis var. sinensis]